MNLETLKLANEIQNDLKVLEEIKDKYTLSASNTTLSTSAKLALSNAIFEIQTQLQTQFNKL